MIMYLENPNESIDKLLELISSLARLLDTRSIYKKSIVLLYTSNDNKKKTKLKKLYYLQLPQKASNS